MQHIHVIGGGLAGCEASYAIANRGVSVILYEMRPLVPTPVHQTSWLGELVCSNSLKSEQVDTAQGLLKQEMRILGSLLLRCAEQARVPAGSALAVDRVLFSQRVTEMIESHPLITVKRQEVTRLPDEPCIIATGPLTSDAFSQVLQEISGQENLYFYDAVAPTITTASLDMARVFKASRYGKGGADYYNCPMNQEEYTAFYQALMAADTLAAHQVDRAVIFEGCMPVEIMGQRGIDTLRFGPMRPVGLMAPGTEQRPYAVVQLRQEDMEGRLVGMVGFQTRLRWGAQDQVFRLIPGLERAEFVRYGVMHRNTYINSPMLLQPTLQLKSDPTIFVAGQITGVEGYMESAASGIWAGINAARMAAGQETLVLPENTMLGSLLRYITSTISDHFQPMNANFGILPPIGPVIKDKKRRYQAYATRAGTEMQEFSELL